jgi:hypothetical protein
LVPRRLNRPRRLRLQRSVHFPLRRKRRLGLEPPRPNLSEHQAHLRLLHPLHSDRDSEVQRRLLRQLRSVSAHLLSPRLLLCSIRHLRSTSPQQQLHPQRPQLLQRRLPILAFSLSAMLHPAMQPCLKVSARSTLLASLRPTSHRLSVADLEAIRSTYQRRQRAVAERYARPSDGGKGRSE